MKRIFEERCPNSSCASSRKASSIRWGIKSKEFGSFSLLILIDIEILLLGILVVSFRFDRNKRIFEERCPNSFFYASRRKASSISWGIKAKEFGSDSLLILIDSGILMLGILEHITD